MVRPSSSRPGSRSSPIRNKPRPVPRAPLKTKAKPKPKPKPKPAARSDAPTVLTSAQARFLRGQAHPLKPLVQIGGKGVTDALVAELDQALEQHELIKVKVAAEDREARDAMVERIAAGTRSAVVQRIGHVAVLYRPSEDKRQIVLPRA